MNIEGLDYNTHRQQLTLPEYGRVVQRMVAHALTIKHRPLRQRCAATIVRIMQRVSPQMSQTKETQHKYWDHLAVLSNFQLDIDYPFDISQAHTITSRPQSLPYHEHSSEVSHYGLLLRKTFNKLRQMPVGVQRDRLAMRVAKQMWHCLQQYSQSTANEEKVVADLAFYTDGIVLLDAQSLHLAEGGHTSRYTDKRKKKVLHPTKRRVK